MACGNSFDISDASYQNYDDIMDLFKSGKYLYFGEHKKKSTTADKFFAYYVVHRILVRISPASPSIIGYAEVSNYPYIPALPGDCWMDWIKFHYCISLPFTAANTCFFNSFIYRKDCNPELIRQVLCEIFYRESKLSYIIVPRCPKYGFGERVRDIPDYYCLEPFATMFYPKCYQVETCPRISMLYVIFRNNILPVMRYRRALPEDNDDIVDIVDNDRPDIKEQLGDYYIAEELLAESKSVLIVTEIFHVTAGFIWLNDDVNIFKLLENYDLEEFGNLLKYNPKEIFKKKQLSINTSQRRPLNELFATEFIKNIYQDEDGVSSCSDNMIDSNETICKQYSHLRKIEKLLGSLKEYEFYIQLRRKKFIVYYNVCDADDNLAPGDAKSNAFVIQLFGLVSSHDVRRIYRFLLTSFAAYPDKDYCLLSVCLANPITSYLLEILKHFIRVPTRPGCLIDEHLYITHRSTIYGELSLYPVRQEDVADIRKILIEKTSKINPSPKHMAKLRISTISHRLSVMPPSSSDSDEDIDPITKDDIDHVMKILRNIFEEPFTKYNCLTIRCGDSTRPIDDNTLVGFVITKPFYSSRCLQKHYYMTKRDELTNSMMAEIVILKLHPLFHSQADTVFCELARQSGFWHFYHFRPTNIHCLPNDLLMNMQPMEPRRIKKIWFGKFDDSPLPQAPSAASTSRNGSTHNKPLKPKGHSIDFINDRFAAFIKTVGPSEFKGNSMSIVILGFTDICKAFLRLMIFSWQRTGAYNRANLLPRLNITVICPPGVMEAEYEFYFKCETCNRQKDCWVNFQNSDAFIKDVRDRMDVRSWIRFINGKISSINTETQLIQMESKCEIYYETLLLMCSTEFGMPYEMEASFEFVPPNYSHINNRFDKLVFYYKLKILKDELPEETTKSIVVYGSHIKAFEFINFLIKHGIKGSDIHLVMPYTTADAQLDLVFNNPAVDVRIEEILREMLEDLAVTIYERMNLTKCSSHEDGSNIKDVTFLSHNGENELTLACDLFVSFYEKHIATAILNILKNGNLDIDDNCIMVDKKYETSMPNIYAIGNFIKHKQETNHQYRYVSPQEAAKKIINSIDADAYIVSATLDERKFSEPFYFQAQLPMDHFFVKVVSPKRYLANHLNNNYGFPLVTYFEGDFTRVRLNQFGMVEEIVIVTKKEMDFDFLKFFCGRHELMLNNLKARWYLKDIVNFIDFFQQEWAELLMHDHFETLRLLNKLLVNPTAQDIAKKNLDRDTKRKLMHIYCQDMGITSQLEYALLDFVREHRHDFSSHIALPEDFPIATKETKYY